MGEAANAAALADVKTRKGLKLFWFSTGSYDFLVQTTRSTVNLFKEYGYAPVYREKRRRAHLAELARRPQRFAPQLFREP